MAVTCSRCGEELFGAVNRCWRCGHHFETSQANSAVPPLLRMPIDIAFRTSPVDADPTNNTAIPLATLDETEFAQPALPGNAVATSHVTSNDPHDSFRGSVAIASIVVAAMSAVGSYFTMWAMVPACLSLFLAWLGFRSNRKRLCFLTLFLASVAFFWGTLQAVSAYQTYQKIRQAEQADWL
ncbi:MAG: hypothetical protein KDA87_16245 [Planctomycetales bacterium]|nr:hypothetical protein [Planctomycetales bacterium]